MAASTSAPLLVDHNRDSLDSSHDEEATPLLGGIATTSPSRPFSTSFHPTLFLRLIALILSLPSFIIFIADNPWFHHSPSIVFLSFAIARQIFVLASYFGGKIVAVRIEIVHPRWRGVSKRGQEKWIKKGVNGVVDGAILVGLLVTSAVAAAAMDQCRGWYCQPRELKAAMILEFVVFGLLLLAIPDCGYPDLVTMDVKVLKPASGVLKLATSVEYGEVEEEEEDETREYARPGKKHIRAPSDEYV